MDSGQRIKEQVPAAAVPAEPGQVLSLALGAVLVALLLIVFAALPAPEGRLNAAAAPAAAASLAGLDCDFLLARARAEGWRKLSLQPGPEWDGKPLAVVTWSPTDALVVLRHAARTECGSLVDARLHDSRFNAGVGSVLRPQAIDPQPVEVWISPGAFEHWTASVVAGDPTALQRQDGVRGAFRVAILTCAIVLVICSLIGALVSRSGEFVRYAVATAVLSVWVAELTGVAGYPARWLLSASWSAPLSVALILPILGYSMRAMAAECAAAWRWPHLDAGLRGAFLAALPLAVLILLAPPLWMGMLSRAVELLAAVWLLFAVGLGCAALRGTPRVGLGVLLATLPLALTTASSSWDPALISGIRAEVTSASATWMALVTLLLAARRLGNVHDDLSRMSRLAFTDALTGLPNRRGAMDYLQRQLGRGPVDNGSLVVAALDIDHFKRINDDHGHARGDLALRLFADTLRRSRRHSDLVARVGGEEFLIALPTAEATQMLRVLKTVRSDLQSSQTVQALGFPLRFSAGVVELHEGESLNALLEEADRQLYAAKRNGRNRDARRGAAPATPIPDSDQPPART